MEIFEYTITELNEKLISKEIGFRELVTKYIDRIEKLDKSLNTYISNSFDAALSKADKLQEKLNKKEQLSILAGIPFALKDNICTKGIITTCASKMLSDFIPPYNATVFEKLLSKDAILLGKLNMDEFAMGGSNETSYFDPVKNPCDNKKVPGGSSGGSAACVSAKLASFALGSDTGGSIRQPSSFCGVVGLKPTYGKVSRYGLIAFASSLDQIGPITNNVSDSAIVLDAISGYDKRDSTSKNLKTPNYYDSLNENIKGMRFAYPKEYFEKGIDNDVKEAVYKAFEKLKEMGADIDEVSFPLTEYAIPTYYIISSAEASSNLSRYDGIKYGKRADVFDDLLDLYIKSRSDGFGSEVKRRIMMGTYALSSGYYDAYYLKALKVRNMIQNTFSELFLKYDAIIGPVAPTTAYKIGEKTDDPMKMYLGDIYTVSANIAGIPAISIPCGSDKDNMPIGLQVMCGSDQEQKMLDISYAYQKLKD